LTLRPGNDASWRRSPAKTEPSGFTSFKTVSRYLTMRDGLRMALDLHLPADLRQGERLPAILRQTRYYRSDDLRWPFSALLGGPEPLTRAFLLNRYAWVDVDVRGSGASEGRRPHPWAPKEVRDGAAIVNWILAQPWSNGKVGATGVSYDGTAAEFLLVNHHPAVKAVAPRFSLFDVWADVAFPGGIHLTWFTENWGRFNRALDRDRLHDVFPPWTRLFVRGVRPVDADVFRTQLDRAVEMHMNNYDVHAGALGLTYRDDPIMANSQVTIDSFSPHARAKELIAAGVPIYSYSGWLDGAYAYAAIKRFQSVRTPGSKLILGPWNHGGTQNISPFSAGQRASFDHSAELLRFFDHYLKGPKKEPLDEPAVAYFTIGEGKWKQAENWPPSSIPRIYYFAPEGRLAQRAPTASDAVDAYTVDPTTGTGDRSRWNSLMGRSDLIGYPRLTSQSKRLLHYTSPPLDRDVEITGHPVVNLFVASTSTDGNFFVYLEDVDEVGRVTYVTEGMLRALHRKLDPSPDPNPAQGVVPRSYLRADGQLLRPAQVTELRFDLQPISYLFKRGHSIRVALAGADKDHFGRPMNELPTVLVHRTQGHPSRIELPEIERTGS
jgi:putative CocE/NonD family hydrolase